MKRPNRRWKATCRTRLYGFSNIVERLLLLVCMHQTKPYPMAQMKLVSSRTTHDTE